MTSQYKTLQLEHIDKHILMVRLHRPELKNAINHDMVNDFTQLWTDLSSDPRETRCVIVTGGGDAFCAGADLKERKQITLGQWKSQLYQLRQSIVSMINCPVPIISAVNGVAFGGGLELVLACDFAYASDQATFAQSEVKWGIIPGALGTQNLPKTCGLKRAKELTFTANVFTAEQAFEWNIINKICEPDKLLAEVIVTAETICSNAPIAVRYAKEALNAGVYINQQDGFHKEIECYEKALATRDREEGMNAFHDKRKPYFMGE